MCPILYIPPHFSRVESEEDQTDSEDDEYMDDVEFQSTTIAKRGVRRESVSAEQAGANAVRIEASALHYTKDEQHGVWGLI